MNKIYKVIWSKAKHTYVVTSEIARSHGKAESTGKGLKKLALALLAVLSIMGPGYATAADYVTVKDTAGTEQTVYTKDGVDSQLKDLAKQTDVDTNKNNIETNKNDIATLQSNTQGISYSPANSGRTIINNNLLVNKAMTVDAGLTVVKAVEAQGFKTSSDIPGVNQLTVSGNTIQGGKYTKEVAINSSYNVSLTAGTKASDKATVSGGNVVNQASYTILNNAGTGIQNNVSGANGYISNSAAQIQSVASKTIVNKAGTSISDQITGTDSEGNTVILNEVKSNENGTTFTNSDSSTTIKGNAISTGSIDATGNITAASADVNGKLTAGSASVTNSLNVGHNVNVGGAVNAGSLNSRGNLNVDGNALVKGTLTSQSTINGKEIVSQTNITAKNKVVGMQGVVDNTLTSGNYVTAGKTVGENIVALDTQVKSNADAITEEAATREAADTALTNRIAAEEVDRAEADTKLQEAIDTEARQRKYSVTNLENADKQLQTNIDNEAATREAADKALDSRTSDLEAKTEAITYDKDSRTVMVDGKLTAAEGITDGTMQDGQYVKTDKYVGQNLNALDQGLKDETAAREAADTAEATARQEADTKLQENIDAEAATRAAEDQKLNKKITAEKKSRIAADTKLVEAVNSGLSLSGDNVLQKNTTTIDAKGNVTTSKTDANEMILNKGNDNQITMNESGIKVGTNSTVMDKDGVYTGGDTYAEAKAAMKSDGSIKGADGKFTVNSANGTVNVNDQIELNGATGVVKSNGLNVGNGNMTVSNSGNIVTNGNIAAKGTLSVANDNFTVNGNGGVTAAGGKITLNSDGSFKAADGNFTVNSNGGVTAVNGKITLNSDGSFKAADGNFTVNSNGGVTAANGKVTLGSDGSIKGADGKFNVDSNGAIKGADGKFTVDSNGAVKAANGNTTIDSNGNLSTKGTVSAANGKFSVDTNGKITSTGLDAGSGTIQTTGTVQAGDVKTGTLETTGDATIGGNLTVDKNLTVNGEFNAKTLSSKLDENNYTEIHGGNVTSRNLKYSDTGELQASSSKMDETGSTVWARDDESIGTSTVTADSVKQSLSDTGDNPTNYASQEIAQNGKNKYEMTDSVVEGNQSNVTKTTAESTDSQIALKDDDGNVLNKSYITQNLKKILQGVEEGDSKTTIEQDANNITNTASNGTITNDADKILNKGATSITSQIGDGSAVKTVMDANGIANTAIGGTISNEAKNITNTAAEKISNSAAEIENTAVKSITSKVGDNVSSRLSTDSIVNQVKDGDKSNTAAQNAEQTDSTITDGKNTAVINQKASSIATSISDGTDGKYNQTYSSVDMSTERIQTSDTQFNASTKTATRSKDTLTNGSTILDIVKDSSTGTISSTVTDGTDTSTFKQTASEVSTNSKNITNIASETISNSAKNITNTTTENMTNTIGKDLKTTVGGEMSTTVTGKVTEDYKSDLFTKVGGNETHAVTGSQTVTVSGDRTVNVKGTETENFNAQITNIKTNQKTSVGGNQTNIVGGDQQNTVSGNKLETVKGSVTEKYGSQATTIDGDQSTNVGGNQTNVVAGNQTNTISGNKTETVKGDVNESYGSLTTNVKNDSSLTAENINNTARNKITNRALDVETDAASSIVNKVSNDSGTNISTQTQEEMSQADGKKASYIRGAAEEKSQLVNGDTKTTIDTIAGQTNTNITDGTNTSNDLQKADQIASSVTDGTNTTVVNQDAKSIASSITDGTRSNKTRSTVDQSAQTIKASDTQYSASTKTATRSEEALMNGSTILDVVKDSSTGTISAAVTDGTNITGTTMTAKDITNTAAENMTNNVGKDLTTTVGGNQKTTVTGDSELTAENVKAIGKTSITSQIGEGDDAAVKTVMNADGIANTATGGTISNTADKIANTATTSITDKVGDKVSRTMSTSSIEDKVGTTTVTTTDGLTRLTNEAGTHKTQMDFAEVLKDLGVRGSATIDGDTSVGGNLAVTGTSTLTGDVTMKSNATVEKNLTVNGTSDLKGDVTMESNATVKKNLTVEGAATTRTLKVTDTSEFEGAATFNDIVTMNKGLSVTGGITADTVTADSYKVGGKTYIDANGINANNQKITNVAAGDISEGSTDAVNGGQLHETNTRVANVENRVTQVETRVDKLDNKIDKVGANAAAMANLHPLEFDADSKWNIAAAIGNSGSETASAVGVFYRPNENVMVNASASMGTGENMFGGGVSVRLGHGGNKAKEAQMKAAAAENQELRKEVNDLTARMDALLSVLNPNMSKEFPDVPANHWAYEAVSRLAGNGIVEGYEDGKYHGERQMTRYEMAEIIYNALSKGAKAEKKLVEEFRPELQAMAAQKKA